MNLNEEIREIKTNLRHEPIAEIYVSMRGEKKWRKNIEINTNYGNWESDA